MAVPANEDDVGVGGTGDGQMGRPGRRQRLGVAAAPARVDAGVAGLQVLDAQGPRLADAEARTLNGAVRRRRRVHRSVICC